MKTIRYNILMLLLMLPCIAVAGDGVKGKYIKEKKISKVWLVNANCGLDVSNKFGSIYVTTWDENKTAIDVVITVSGNNEDKVTKRLAGIDVNFNATTALVSAKTIIENMSGGSNNLSLEINYTIKIPKKGSIDLLNQYGATAVGKIYGKSNIDCQYGDLTIDELNNEVNIIKMQYGNASRLNYIKSGDINIQYSNLNIINIGSLKLRAQYTDSTINEAQDITYKTEYGNLNIRKGGKISGSGDYSDLKFGLITGIFNATCNYGNIKISAMNKDIKNIAINATYSDIVVYYNEQMPFDFEFNLDYGDLRGSSSFKFSEKREKDTSSYYKGYYKNSGVNKMYIKSQFGDISLNKG